MKGIEPSYEAWEAAVLPLNYTRAGDQILAGSGSLFRAMNGQPDLPFAAAAAFEVVGPRIDRNLVTDGASRPPPECRHGARTAGLDWRRMHSRRHRSPATILATTAATRLVELPDSTPKSPGEAAGCTQSSKSPTCFGPWNSYRGRLRLKAGGDRNFAGINATRDEGPQVPRPEARLCRRSRRCDQLGVRRTAGNTWQSGSRPTIHGSLNGRKVTMDGHLDSVRTFQNASTPATGE